MELTDAQIAKLTPEQVSEFEDNPESREGILASISDEQPEQAEEDAANGEGEEAEQEEPQEEPEAEEPVVLTKNGKGTIPYEKYKELRVENATLREKMQSLQKVQTELESLKAQKAEATTPGKRAAIQKQLEGAIAKLNEDFPDIGTSLSSVNELITDLSREIESDKEAMKKKQEEEQAERERILAEQVQEAKENNPDLSYWEHNDPDAWQEAMMQDHILFNSPKWAKKPIEERFAEVVKRVRTLMPDASEPPNAEPSEKTRKKAKAKLDEAVERKPTTLSDIKGGANPVSEKEQIENLPPHELAKRLMQMPSSKAAAMRADLD